jgi:hypothetical protein
MSGPSPCVYKREVQGHPGGGFARGEGANEQAPSLSLSRRACNPYYERHPWCRIIQGLSRLLCSIPRQPIWAGARSDNLTRRSRDPSGHSGRPRHPPCWRRRRRHNHGHAGVDTLSVVAPERVDDAGTPPGDMSGIVLAPETTAGVTSPRRVNPKRTDNASTLAKDLLGVTLVPEMTVCSAPTRLHDRPSTKRYCPFSILYPFDSASIHLATPLR